MTEQRHIWMLFSCMIMIGQARKQIMLTKVQCPIKSNLLAKIECDAEVPNSINIMVTTNDNVINTLVGISKLRLYAYGRNNVMRLNGIRLDICNLLGENRKISLLSMLYAGIFQTDNNLPQECPFKTNTTYSLRNMKFDAKYLPNYLPDYNFTFIGSFQANKVNSFEVRVNGSLCDSENDCTGLTAANKSVDIKNVYKKGKSFN